MFNTARIISEVEQAVASKDEDWRLSTLRRVSDMFLSEQKRVDSSYILSFDVVLFVLSRSIETAARAALAERVADAANPLPELLKSFALDREVEVAAPVLERSLHLDEATLVHAAEIGGMHHLKAIARRPELSEAITDVIVKRGDDEVVEAVAGNEGARFSAGGFDSLFQRAQRSEGVFAAVSDRQDIPVEHFSNMLMLAKARARENLEQDLGPEAMLIVDDVIEGARLTPGDAIDPADIVRRFQASEVYVARRARNRMLQEIDITTWLGKRQTEDVVAGLALMTGCPMALVVHAFFAPDYYPVLFLASAAELSWPTLKTILAQRLARPLPPETIEGAYAAYSRLSPDTARRVLRFVKLRARQAKIG